MVQPPPRDGKRRDYCFVHFADHSAVERLIADGAKGNKPELDGNPLDVSTPLPCQLVLAQPAAVYLRSTHLSLPFWGQGLQASTHEVSDRLRLCVPGCPK